MHRLLAYAFFGNPCSVRLLVLGFSTDLRVILEQVSKHTEEIERGWNEQFS
jgi:hypothetical protein